MTTDASKSSSSSSATPRERMTFSVNLPDGQTYTVVGYLHHKGGYANKPLQLLLHGATYTHRYWTLSEEGPSGQSYIDFMVRHGYAVLALDLLGSGESSRPADGDLLTLANYSDTVHQVVTQLKSGQNSLKTAFGTIVPVGHSLGSAVAIHAQGTHKDFPAVVTTGMGHEPHMPPAPPELPQRAMSQPYFHFLPQERTALFFHPPTTRQAVLDHDNATFKEPVGRGVFLTVMARGFEPEVTRVNQVEGPVLVLLGEHDAIYPGSNASKEAGHWPKANVTVQVIAGAGHSVNAHQGSQASWTVIANWLRARLGDKAFAG